MSRGLPPSAETAPVVPADATPEQRIAIWLDLLRTGHKLPKMSTCSSRSATRAAQPTRKRWSVNLQ